MRARSYDEATLSPEARERIDLTWQWLHEFPIRPHPDLGRTGPVCPYMGPALGRGAVSVFPFDARDGEEALVHYATTVKEEFVRLSDGHPDRTYLVSFVVPYGLAEDALRELMMRVHARLRPDFVQQGLLAGDFWPDHATRGLHSSTFRPFESPLPIFAVRHMIPSDLPFFTNPDNSPQERLTYLGYYREVFQAALPAYWRDRLDAAEREAQAALAESQEPQEATAAR